MMRVVVIGEGERAAAHRLWYRQAGVELVQAGGDEAMELPVAALYDLCAEAEERRHALDRLLRRRHAAVLLAGCVASTADAALRLVTAARRRRCELVVTGGARFVPAMARLREFVCGGILGAIREVHIQVVMPSVLAAEAMAAGMDLGLWLAGDAAPVAESATPGRTSFQAGTARVMIEGRVDAAQEGTAWRAGIMADLGQALGAAVFHPGLPGRACQHQSLVITLSGRQRCFELPDADPAGNELAAILARQAAGLPWLALCTAERAARLLAVQEEGAGKVSAARVRSS
jgi:predicted dehydrogenase